MAKKGRPKKTQAGGAASEPAAQHGATTGRPAGVKITMHGVEMLDPAGIERNPWQPRCHFDAAEANTLASDMAAGVQLQPILVRRAAGPFAYQLLCGERRWRAAKRANVEIRAQICECSDRDARMVALHENTRRQDLSAVEVARSYQMMLDNGDATGPTDLAELLGVAQSTVSNRLRLLGLPESWQGRVISREITERHARAVLPYKDDPAALAAIETAFTENLEDGEAPTVAEWESWIIPRAVRGTSDSTDAETEQESLPHSGGEVGSEQAVTEIAGGEAEDDHPDVADDGGETDPAPAEELDRRVEPMGKDFDSRLWGWKLVACRKMVSDNLAVASAEDLMRLASLALTQWTGALYDGDLREALRAAGSKRFKDPCKELLSLQDHECDRVLASIVERLFWTKEAGPVYKVPAEELLQIVAFLKIDLESEWTAGRIAAPEGYWNLHSKAQLLAIAGEVKLADHLSAISQDEVDSWETIKKCSKSDLIAVLMRAMPSTEDGAPDGIPMPKEISRAKAPKR
jgi:ParB/RepB/Spo0J family partition protein